MNIPIITSFQWLLSIAATALITILIQRWMRTKIKVIGFVGYCAHFKVNAKDTPPYDFSTHSLVLRNTGSCPAKDVQIIHEILPDYFNVSPGIESKVLTLEDGSRSIIFPTLLPGEQVTISYMYTPSIQSRIHTGFRHQDGLVKIVQVLPVRIYPKWVYYLFYFLVICGLISFLFFLCYMFFPIIQFSLD